MEIFTLLDGLIMTFVERPQTWGLFIVSVICELLSLGKVKLSNTWILFVISFLIFNFVTPPVAPEYQGVVTEVLLTTTTILLSLSLIAQVVIPWWRSHPEEEKIVWKG